jgi:hypothetical protein
LWSRLAWVKKWDPIFKITRAKRAGGMAQMVALLPRKCRTLSSNSDIKRKYIYREREETKKEDCTPNKQFVIIKIRTVKF